MSASAEYRCPDCSFVARHPMGLGRHRTTRHGAVSKRAARAARAPKIARPTIARATEPAPDLAWTTRKEAATRAGVHLNTIRNWEQEGRLPVRKVPGRRELQVDVEALNRIVAERGRERRPARDPSPPAPSVSRAREPLTTPSRRPGRDVYACVLAFAGDAGQAFRTSRLIVLADALQAAGIPSDLIEDLDQGDLDREGSTHLRWRTLRDGEDEAWTLVAQRPHERDRSMRWRVEAKVVRESGRAWASLRHALQPEGFRIAPVQVQASAPKAVELLLRGLEVIADGRRITSDPVIVDAPGVPALVELLAGAERILPVVVVSLERATNLPLADPGAIARALAGLAHTCVFDRADTSFALTDSLGDKRSVFQGAIRLYWPGFSHVADPWAHPLFLSDRIATETRAHGRFERFLLAQLVPVAALRLPASEVESRAQQRGAREQRSAQEAARKRAHSGLDAEWHAELERAWSEEERLRAQVAGLEARLERTEAELAEALTRAAAARGSEEPPASVGEATERAAARAQNLVFLQEALSAAWRSPYQQPERILRALLALDEVAGAYRRGEMGRSIKAECEARGLPYRSHTSQTARGKYRREYERSYEGRTIQLGPHIAFGVGPPRTCARIYFYIDEETRRFVVGHVGGHLRDTHTG